MLNAAKDEDKLPLGAGSQPGWKKWATKLNRLLGRHEGSASAMTSFDVCQKVYDAAKKEETTGGEDTADQEERFMGLCRECVAIIEEKMAATDAFDATGAATSGPSKGYAGVMLPQVS